MTDRVWFVEPVVVKRPTVIPVSSAFAGYRFPPGVILLAVRWYLRYGLSYRDLEELLAERGIEVDHVTIYRWVQRFTPLLTRLPDEAWVDHQTSGVITPRRAPRCEIRGAVGTPAWPFDARRLRAGCSEITIVC